MHEEIRVHVTKITQMETTITTIRQERDDMKIKIEGLVKRISELENELRRKAEREGEMCARLFSYEQRTYLATTSVFNRKLSRW